MARAPRCDDTSIFTGTYPQPGVWFTVVIADEHSASLNWHAHAVHPGFDPLAAKQRWRRH
jgi:hypothetical protein